MSWAAMVRMVMDGKRKKKNWFRPGGGGEEGQNRGRRRGRADLGRGWRR
jgi:hypothetical protein